MARKTPTRVLEEGLQGLHNDHLLCRDIRHQWEEQGGFRLPVTFERDKPVKPKVVSRVLVCRRCGTEREDIYDIKNFERIGTSHYVYPQGYIIKGNSIRHYGPQVRKEHYRRVQDR